MYKYETHLHTSQGSACARSTGREMAIAHKNAGYQGIIVTDHFFYGNTAPDRNLPWDEWVSKFCMGYREAKATGDEIGLDVFFGWESGYNGTEFLIYGLDEEWLMNHPQIRDASVEEQFRLVHDGGGIVIHAHPFREAPYIPEIRLYPDFVDGIEVYNASNVTKHLSPEYNDKAFEYAAKYSFPITSGSDVHSIDVIGSGLLFDRKLNTINDFIQEVLNKNCQIAFVK